MPKQSKRSVARCSAKAGHGSRDSREDPVPPTPETLRKLKSDVVERLHAKGSLNKDHLLACEDIRAIWEAWSRGLFPKARRMDADFHTPGRQAYRDPIDRMHNREFDLWHRRYLPWSREMRRIRVSRSGITRHRLVMEIVVENFAPRQLEAYYHLRHGAALVHLCEGLSRYVEAPITRNRK